MTALNTMQELEYRRNAHTAALMLMVAQLAGAKEDSLDAYLLPYAKLTPEPPLPIEVVRDLRDGLRLRLIPQELIDAIGGRTVAMALRALEGANG